MEPGAKGGSSPGVDIGQQLDVVDEVDVGDVVEGVLPVELLIFFAESAQLHSAKTAKIGFVGFGTMQLGTFSKNQLL